MMGNEANKIRLIMELRRQGITDKRVLAAIERVPRELFVPANFGTEAYDNIPLPIGQGQTISQPYIVAYMTQALELGERMRVLEIGTGSGYQAAVLARLCRRVCTIERFKSLLREAEERFRQLKLHNITTRHGDGYKGWPELAPFERIIVTAAAPEVPQPLIDQLDVGGILIAPVHIDGEQALVKLRRGEEGITREVLLAVRFVPLVEGIARSAD
tara:strand:- start:121 stop:765 length:645 start_codon:yes stop_codon:yes gene_type:complete